MSEEPLLEARARRAIPLIAAALAVIAVAGLLYMRAGIPTSTAVTRGAPRVPQLAGRYSVSYDFISPTAGWSLVVQQSFVPTFWIFQTVDGARHWQKQFEGIPQGSPQFIRFFDRQHGFAHAGDLYRTQDGGAHWQKISVPEGTPNVVFASATHGWAVAVGPDQASTAHLYSTLDGGLFWKLLEPASYPSAMGSSVNPDFRTDGEGWTGADGSSPTVYSTRDGGSTWHAIALPIGWPSGVTPTPPGGKGFPVGYHTSVVLLPGNGVIAQVADYSGAVGRTFTSFDRGQSWRLIVPPPAPTQLSDLSFVDSRHWWASRWDVLFKTSDAGQTWTSVHTVTPDLPGDWTFEAAHVIDAAHAWLRMTSANRRNGATGLEMTSDGGVHWFAANVPEPG